MKKVFGWILLALFVFGLIAVDAAKSGWVAAIATFAITALLAAVLIVAVTWIAE